MLTRFVRTQLIIFTIASIIGALVMVFGYMQVPTLLGLGRITVTLQLPRGGGLYQFSNVTYRGVQVGKVTDIKIAAVDRAEATLSLQTSPRIPADLRAEVHSMSAVGEQYVDLLPLHDAPPYLHDGSVIAKQDTTVPQQIGPILDQVSALVNSIPKDKFADLLDETFHAFNGAGYDVGSLLDSSSTLSANLSGAVDQTRTLADDSVPFLNSQAQSGDALREWAHSLAGVTDQLRRNDPQIRTLLQNGPGFANETSRLLNQIKPTLPILLANLTTLGQVAVTYNPSLEQLLVLLPPYVGALQTYGRADNNPTGYPLGEFAVTLADPPPCTVGFLPPSQWRNPADTTTADTPDGLYCKLPQDSPLAVRGARNYPCMGHPGKRAPTVQICDSDKPFEPLAMREHATGPYPIDPNLIAQGVPPDSRVNEDQSIFGPTEGTPLPGQTTAEVPSPLPAGAGPTLPDTDAPTTGGAALPAPPNSEPPAEGTATPQAAPSGFDTTGQPGPVAVATYNPHTGEYLASDGKWYRQSNLGTATSTSWKDLLLPQG